MAGALRRAGAWALAQRSISAYAASGARAPAALLGWPCMRLEGGPALNVCLPRAPRVARFSTEQAHAASPSDMLSSERKVSKLREMQERAAGNLEGSARVGRPGQRRMYLLSQPGVSGEALAQVVAAEGRFFQPPALVALLHRMHGDGGVQEALLATSQRRAEFMDMFQATLSRPSGPASPPLVREDCWDEDTFRFLNFATGRLLDSLQAPECSIRPSAASELSRELAYALVEGWTRHPALLAAQAAARPIGLLHGLRQLTPWLHTGDAQVALDTVCAALLPLLDAPSGQPELLREVLMPLALVCRLQPSAPTLPREMSKAVLHHLRAHPSGQQSKSSGVDDLADLSKLLVLASKSHGVQAHHTAHIVAGIVECLGRVPSKHARNAFPLAVDAVWAAAHLHTHSRRWAGAGGVPQLQPLFQAFDAFVQGAFPSGRPVGRRSAPSAALPHHLLFVRALWAHARVDQLTPAITRWFQSWMGDPGLALHSLDPEDLAVVAWALRQTSAFVPAAWRQLEKTAVSEEDAVVPLEDWPFPALCLFAHALAGAHQGSPGTWALLMRVLAARRGELVDSPASIPQVLETFHARGVYPPRLTKDILSTARLALTSLTPSQLLRVLQCAGASGLPAKRLYKRGARMLHAALLAAADSPTPVDRTQRRAWRAAVQATVQAWEDAPPACEPWFNRAAVGRDVLGRGEGESGSVSDSDSDISDSDSDSPEAQGLRRTSLAASLPAAWRPGCLAATTAMDLVHHLATVDVLPWRVVEAAGAWLLAASTSRDAKGWADAEQCLRLLDAMVLGRYWCGPLAHLLAARAGIGMQRLELAAAPEPDDNTLYGELGLPHPPLALGKVAGEGAGSGLSVTAWASLHRVNLALQLGLPVDDPHRSSTLHALPLPARNRAGEVSVALQGQRQGGVPHNADLGLSRYLDLRGLPLPYSSHIEEATGLFMHFAWDEPVKAVVFFDPPTSFNVAAARRGSVLVTDPTAHLTDVQAPHYSGDEDQDSMLHPAASPALAFTGATRAGAAQQRAGISAGIGSSSPASWSRGARQLDWDPRARPVSPFTGEVSVGDASSGGSREVKVSRLRLKPAVLLERYLLSAAGWRVISIPFTAWSDLSPADTWRLVAARASVPVCDDDSAGRIQMPLEQTLDMQLLPLLQPRRRK